jgi:hypothetical protein
MFITLEDKFATHEAAREFASRLEEQRKSFTFATTIVIAGFWVELRTVEPIDPSQPSDESTVVFDSMAYAWQLAR